MSLEPNTGTAKAARSRGKIVPQILACVVSSMMGGAFGGGVCFALVSLSLADAGASAGVQDMDVSGMFNLCCGVGVVLGTLCGLSAGLFACKAGLVGDPQ